jgi:phosphoglycerate kinase
MKKLTVREVDVRGRRVLVRVDYNVPLQGLKIQDDSRIRETLPTLRYLLEQKAKIVLMAHAGRPKAKDPALSLKPMGARLSELLKTPVKTLDDCVGPGVLEAVKNLRPGEFVLLENLRYYPGEELDEPAFAAALAALGDVYVNDAFGVSHRAHASVHSVPRNFKQACAGFLMEKEIGELGRLVENPDKPFVAVLGGAKVSDKISVIERLLPKLDTLLIGGAMAYTFIKSAGVSVGNSLVENDKLEVAQSIRAAALARGVNLLLPRDHRVVRNIRDSLDMRLQSGAIPNDWMGIDIGNMAIQEFKSELVKARTVFWNGPLGAFEMEAFAKGTFEIARAIAALSATKIIGGGDTALAVERAGVRDRMTHVSTGGGASLEFLEGKELPGIAALTDG